MTVRLKRRSDLERYDRTTAWVLCVIVLGVWSVLYLAGGAFNIVAAFAVLFAWVFFGRRFSRYVAHVLRTHVGRRA